jgi:hypothetical protein
MTLCFFLWVAASVFLFPTNSAKSETLSHVKAEYQIKAAFLYNFTRFIEWPNADQAGGKAVFQIGILGTDPFGAEIDTLSGKKVRDRSVIVGRYLTWDDRIKECDILFISGSESARLSFILDKIKGVPVLTIGDSESFASRGVMLNFFTESDKVRFEINLKQAQIAGLKVSSQLIILAKVIDQ